MELGVSDGLSMHGSSVPQDLAMAVVLDALLAKSYFPDGFVEVVGGRRYRYAQNPPE